MREVKGISKLPEAPSRWLCKECGCVCTDAAFLYAPSPFDDADELIGCPVCKSVDSFVAACWKCDRAAGTGMSGAPEFRYIQTCFEHRPKKDS